MNYIVRPLFSDKDLIFSDKDLKVVPYHLMGGWDGKYIRHLAGMKNADRTITLQAEARRRADTDGLVDACADTYPRKSSQKR